MISPLRFTIPFSSRRFISVSNSTNAVAHRYLLIEVILQNQDGMLVPGIIDHLFRLHASFALVAGLCLNGRELFIQKVKSSFR